MSTQTSAPKESFSSSFNSLLRPFVVAWPLLLGLVCLWPRMPESSLRFLNNFGTAFTWLPIDCPVIIIWLLTIFWPFAFILLENKKDKATLVAQKQFDDTLRTAPNFKIFYKARSYFDSCVAILQKLDALQAEFAVKNYSRKDEIITAFYSIILLTKDITADFFQSDDSKIGVNYMLYFKNIPAHTVLNQKFLGANALYVRPQRIAELEGVLYLPPELNSPSALTQLNMSYTLAMPIYKLTAKVYVGPAYMQRNDIALPGAPTAFFLGNSIIGDTLEPSNYANLDTVTSTEIMEYFGNQVAEVRSIASFSITGPGNQADPIGVINIECMEKSTLQRDENHFNTFYTMLYPALKSSEKCLKMYRDYLLDTL